MTRYRVTVADALLDERPWLPIEGFRLVSVDGPWAGHPDVTICTFDDDGAPADLEGKLVNPTLRRIDPPGTVIVTDRSVVDES